MNDSAHSENTVDRAFPSKRSALADEMREGESLISRSQAKRALEGVEQFKEVVFDFQGVDEIGQAFADEIFRVFAAEHPTIKLTAVNAGPGVLRMIKRAEALGRSQEPPAT